MRIEKLQVSGFGHLHGLQIELNGPVTVLYGPNEAGKSTLLGFVRAMLFGIPSRTYGAERYEPSRGGTHGGMLEIRSGDGLLWRIERYAGSPEGASLPGTKGDRLRITRTGLDGQLHQFSQEEMQRDLLGGMSKNMFRQLFAVSLTELQEVSALQSEEMSRFLFHAGIGGGAAVLRGEKKLVQHMDKLYRPRGRNQEIAKMLQAVEVQERQAGAVKSLLPRYHEVLKELEELDISLTASETELDNRSKEAARLQKAVACRQDWMQREMLRKELAELPERSPFPEQGLPRWEALQEEKQRLRLEAGELTRKLAALRLEMDAAVPDSAILEQEQMIRGLAARLPGYESRMAELAELRAEAEQAASKLAQCLRSIHPEWTAERLRSFANTIGEQEAVRQYLTRFAAYDKEMDLLYNERFKLEREVASLKTAFTQAGERLQESMIAGHRQFSDLVPQDRDEIRNLWNEINVLLERWRAAADSRLESRRAADAEAAVQARLRTFYQRILGGSAVLTVVLPAVLGLTTKSGWSAMIAGVILLGLDGVLAYGLLRTSKGSGGHPGPDSTGGQRRSQRTRLATADPAAAEEARLSELMPRLLRQPLSAAGREVPAWALTEPQHWGEEERLLRRLMETWQLWAQRHEALETQAGECRFKVAAKIEELEGLERELSRKEAAFAGLAREWESWLQERQLPGELSAEATLDVFRLAEQGREWLGRLDALTVKIEASQEEIRSFEWECLDRIGVVSGGNPLQLGAVSAGLRKAVAELEIQLDLKARLERLESKRSPLEEELGRTTDRLDAVLAAERHLLDESGAEDGEAYLRYGAEAARKVRLINELKQAELVVFGNMDEGHKRELEELMRGREEEELVRLAEDARRRRQDAELDRQRLQERRGRLLQEQESLEARGLQEDLQQQLAEHQAALGDALDRYAVMAVSQELISRVRRIYEEERQPQVLQAASGYLETMTSGVYRRILVKMGSQELMAEHRDHGPIGSSYLSRGTAEQLYLAMRLALSEAVSIRNSMPILLDDLFVNFDAGRLAGALSVLTSVAENHQLIMMTCHDHVIEGVKLRFQDAQIIHMG